MIRSQGTAGCLKDPETFPDQTREQVSLLVWGSGLARSCTSAFYAFGAFPVDATPWRTSSTALTPGTPSTTSTRLRAGDPVGPEAMGGTPSKS
ncbi:hypothetical protein A1Q1_05304 [Trichosporon asahii var. asahii CBS 2479]|uniref:Uncharacterized protein n=1 Tax=Trichosporon asahii var. asahii (strain ATCC 90039 / CBS 2479 / JCM 2466 / KCTC 7840 / NBRC 103889/ NCYC 2677 / UAMH 7654) TaxID=1186058 RepID=J5Q9F4_TRIAS|nr:hypothetical protein A1Q1_05304 [Trichosporon asahii var. asahii CBS 2479]EJT46183.1 hypothetical protein A1Q1_05304 [Trichosporon asahii var. asahii CBS 2479]